MKRVKCALSRFTVRVRLNPPEPGFDGPRHPPRRGPSRLPGHDSSTCPNSDSTIGTMPRQTNAGR
jgi:hypothetical protein